MPEPYRANEFVVEIGTVESPTVSKVSGLSLGETEAIEMPEGGTNVVRKVSSGIVKFQPLTIERYVDGSQDDQNFKTFFEDMFKHGGGGRGSTVRRDGAIVKKHFGAEVFRIMFYDAWVKSASFSDLEAGSTSLLRQIVVVEHNGLEWKR
ncbi:phage tail protein [Streptomyces fulvoviolaceus]|uniref:phage tail protein n=1 Tax=Streptomyces fulvoviolaceus TaxID=285535 RepID=UPI0004C75117|nr:phage tail protein [Streptomyces fulvoviolaceus]MCT9078074.1 phage tail protein [Streptomyces fulvoviolaceus]